MKQRLDNLIRKFRAGQAIKWDQPFFPSLHRTRQRALNAPPKKKVRKQSTEEDNLVLGSEASILGSQSSILGSQSSFIIPFSGTPPSTPPLAQPTSTPSTAPPAIFSSCSSSADTSTVSPSHDAANTANAADDVDLPGTRTTCARTPAEIVSSLDEIITTVERCKEFDDAAFLRPRLKGFLRRSRRHLEEVVNQPVRAPTSRDITYSICELMSDVSRCKELEEEVSLRSMVNTLLKSATDRLESFMVRQTEPYP